MNVYRRDAGLLCFVLNDGSRDTFAGRLLPNRGLVNRCADRRRHRPLQLFQLDGLRHRGCVLTDDDGRLHVSASVCARKVDLIDCVSGTLHGALELHTALHLEVVLTSLDDRSLSTACGLVGLVHF